MEVTSAVTIVFTPCIIERFETSSGNIASWPLTQVGKTASDQTTGEGDKLWTCLQVLPVTGRLSCHVSKIEPQDLSHLCQELEGVILKNVDALVICAEVVYLLPDVERVMVDRESKST